MSESSITSSPSLRSRLPQSSLQRAQLLESLQWLATTPLNPISCPTLKVTEIITNSTAIGKVILSKFDPANLQTVHNLMRATDSRQLVTELRSDLYLRRLKARKCDQILAMIAAFEWDTFANGEEGKVEDWEALATACLRALENTELLEGRLEWCEKELETGKAMLSAAAAERRVWDGEEGVWTVGLRWKRGEAGRGRGRIGGGLASCSSVCAYFVKLLQVLR